MEGSSDSEALLPIQRKQGASKLPSATADTIHAKNRPAGQIEGPAGQQLAHMLEGGYIKALNRPDCIFQDGLVALNQRFHQEQAKIICIEELTEHVAEWLEGTCKGQQPA